jgi:hypothetical protein
MNNTMVREIRGAKINPKPSLKNYGAQNTRGRKLREQIRYDILCSEILETHPFEKFCYQNVGPLVYL